MTTIDDIITAAELDCRTVSSGMVWQLCDEIRRLRKELLNDSHNTILCPKCNPIITSTG